jgi:CheY-like chemotaxis protein
MSAPILLVEDNDDDIFFFQRAMKRAALTHPLFVVKDGRQALEYLQGHGHFSDRAKFPVPSFIILDLQLPYLNGMEVLEWIRNQSAFPTAIVIIFTSSHLETEINRAYRLGANSFVVKPASADRLVQVVRQLFGYWLDVNTQAAPLA